MATTRRERAARAPRHMNWSRGDAPGPTMRAGRWSLRPGAVLGEPHRHHFVEVFLVEAGAGWHRVNDRVHPLHEGDCWFLRPDDAHTLEAAEDASLAWINISFGCATERSLRQRYGSELDDWPWDRRGEPRQRRIPPARLPGLLDLAARMPVEGGRRIDLDSFVTALFRALDPPAPQVAGTNAPAWLAAALDRLAGDADLLAEGYPALVREAGRNPEYLNRCVRAAYGHTATDLVRHLQLDRAARRLRLTTTPIVDIALACGFENLSYFYRCFRARYGRSPRRFRHMSQ